MLTFFIDDCARNDSGPCALIPLLWPYTEGERGSYGCFFVQLPTFVPSEQSVVVGVLTENWWWEYWYPCHGRNPCRCLPNRHIPDCEKLTKSDHRMLHSSLDLWNLFQQLGACIPGWLHRLLPLYFDVLFNPGPSSRSHSWEGSTLHQLANSACEHYERYGMDLLRYPQERYPPIHDQLYRLHDHGCQPAFLPLGCRFSIIWVYLDPHLFLWGGFPHWRQGRKWWRAWSCHWKRPRRGDSHVKGRDLV